MLLCCAGDYHHGEKSNSHKFNKQLIEYSEFCIREAKKRGCTTFFQAGDYFHNRSKIDVSTLNYAIENAALLSANFKDIYTLVGNHDTYYLESLDVASTRVLEPFMTVIKEPTIVGNVIITPWIVDGKAWDEFVEMSHTEGVEIALGHFEFNGFIVNDLHEMEHGNSHRELRHLDIVGSGHYHSIQEKDNVTYFGSALPITMNEANGRHGCFFIDTETKEVEFVEYETVKIISDDYRKIFDRLEGCDPENTTIRVEFPSDLPDPTLIKHTTDKLDELGFTDRKIQYDDKRTQEIMKVDTSDVKEVENIDAVVAENIKNSAQIAGIDNDLLGTLYNEAKLREA